MSCIYCIQILKTTRKSEKKTCSIIVILPYRHIHSLLYEYNRNQSWNNEEGGQINYSNLEDVQEKRREKRRIERKKNDCFR